jgi:hypothetical protein
MDPYRTRRGSRVHVHAGEVEIQDGQMARIAVHIACSSLHSLGEGRVLVKNPVVGSPIWFATTGVTRLGHLKPVAVTGFLVWGDTCEPLVIPRGLGGAFEALAMIRLASRSAARQRRGAARRPRAVGVRNCVGQGCELAAASI